MHCDCNTNSYCYEPAGRVVTGDLNIIRDARLRSLIGKGPSYREQNRIDWERICKTAVPEYKHKWSLKEGVDTKVFNEWECKVNQCIEQFLRK